MACLGDVHPVCSISADLNSVGLDNFGAKRDSGKISGFKAQPDHHAIDKVKIIIGAADLEFELWFMGV